MKGKKFRKFNGKLYELAGASKTKKDAERRAKNYRKRGIKARIIKLKDKFPYHIYRYPHIPRP